MRLFGRKKKERTSKTALVLVEDVASAMKAENLLSRVGISAKVVAPPPHLRKGCDLSVEFSIDDIASVERILRRAHDLSYEIAYLSSEDKPADIYRVKRFDNGKYLMVRCANMKITVDTETNRLVNVSGGGCPDVPSLTYYTVGKDVHEAEKVIEEKAYSLCGYMLKKAFYESKELLEAEKC
jgi:hypothetical protein